MQYLSYADTPIQRLRHPLLDRFDVRLSVKREDLNHPKVSGNKWWKLKWNLNEARSLGYSKLLTFGGAYSNHIYATAAAAAELGFESVGIIRGEEQPLLNPTLSFAASVGMELCYVSRDAYRKKETPEFLSELHERFGHFYLIPEGGTNPLAVRGCEEFAMKIPFDQYDIIALPVGTAGTITGVISAARGAVKVLGVPVLKGGEFLYDSIKTLMGDRNMIEAVSYGLLTQYHHGGYGKVSSVLLNFMREIEETNALPLDQVYTGKMLFALFEEISKGGFEIGTNILAIHTGGLQGRTSWSKD